MKRFKLSLVAAALAASASLAACGNDAPSNTAANTSNASSTSGANANAGAQATPAANAAATPAAADQFASARADYQNFCIKCHKEDGSGGTVELEDGEKIKVPNFRAEKHTEEQFIRKISNGDPDEGMPAFKNRLEPAQIAALARFILHEFPAGAASGPAAAKPPAH